MARHTVAKYGPVSGIYLGKIPAVIIADFNILKGSTYCLTLPKYFMQKLLFVIMTNTAIQV